MFRSNRYVNGSEFSKSFVCRKILLGVELFEVSSERLDGNGSFKLTDQRKSSGRFNDDGRAVEFDASSSGFVKSPLRCSCSSRNA